MTAQEVIQQEVANLRAELVKLETQASALEQKVANIPSEVVTMTEEAFARVRDWFKGL